MDVVSIASQMNACVVFPTHDHAIHYWPRYKRAIQDQHEYRRVKTSRTSLYMFRTHTLLRMWIPYEREPTRAMDYEVFRNKFVLLSPYGRREATG